MNQMVPLQAQLIAAYKARRAREAALAIKQPRLVRLDPETLAVEQLKEEMATTEKRKAQEAREQIEQTKRALEERRKNELAAAQAAAATEMDWRRKKTLAVHADVTRIVHIVSKAYRIEPDDLLGPSRHRGWNTKGHVDVITPRHVAIYLCRTILHLSTIQIGREFKKDHSSICHVLQKIASMIAADESFAARVKQLSEAVAGA